MNCASKRLIFGHYSINSQCKIGRRTGAGKVNLMTELRRSLILAIIRHDNLPLPTRLYRLVRQLNGDATAIGRSPVENELVITHILKSEYRSFQAVALGESTEVRSSGIKLDRGLFLRLLGRSAKRGHKQDDAYQE